MKWSAKIIKYRGESRIAVHFEKDVDMIARIKQFEDSKWSQQLKVWHLCLIMKKTESDLN